MEEKPSIEWESTSIQIILNDISENDPNYLLVGTDGGIYESFDDSKTWKFVNNLPLTQYYKLAVDDAYPFYNIYGGTQDTALRRTKSNT